MSSGHATSPAPKTYSPDCLDYLLQIASRRVKSQGNAFDQLDSKTGVILGFATVAVLQVLAAVFQLWSSSSKAIFVHPYLFLLGTISVAEAAACGLFALAPKDFDYGPDLESLRSKASDLQEMKLFALEHYRVAIKDNENSNEKKVGLATWADRLLFAGLAFFVLSIMILYLPSL